MGFVKEKSSPHFCVGHMANDTKKGQKLEVSSDTPKNRQNYNQSSFLIILKHCDFVLSIYKPEE